MPEQIPAHRELLLPASTRLPCQNPGPPFLFQSSNLTKTFRYMLELFSTVSAQVIPNEVLFYSILPILITGSQSPKLYGRVRNMPGLSSFAFQFCTLPTMLPFLKWQVPSLSLTHNLFISLFHTATYFSSLHFSFIKNRLQQPPFAQHVFWYVMNSTNHSLSSCLPRY